MTKSASISVAQSNGSQIGTNYSQKGQSRACHKRLVTRNGEPVRSEPIVGTALSQFAVAVRRLVQGLASLSLKTVGAAAILCTPRREDDFILDLIHF